MPGGKGAEEEFDPAGGGDFVVHPELIPLDFTDYHSEAFEPERSLRSIKEDRLRQALKEAKDNHRLRKRHAKHLFRLALWWIVVLWIVLLLQGFGKFPIPSLLDNYYNLSFKLSDTAFIAFMTSTTATVVGLYGIAAYWLFKAPKSKTKTRSRSKESESTKKE